MISKKIVFFGKDCVVACDGRCDKAWGHNGRPRTKLSVNPDDYVYLADEKLDKAPGPGDTNILSEGCDLKPSAVPVTDGEVINRWCTRECERSTFVGMDEPLVLRDMSNPKPNIPR